ncbi:hypothetical protein BpHYR1_045244 [Brachionus plicatilis]|uniref:Uncharacterized protein n=1 Tax=Brachionus plicatilis TaxID=10195 RepID=A0A3M7SGY9_BRAPC|nr:hypothetical protein BpHYR1_045244 [Brachionus plicatilis]
MDLKAHILQRIIEFLLLEEPYLFDRNRESPVKWKQSSKLNAFFLSSLIRPKFIFVLMIK